jgi:hypothetical protein
MIMHDSPTELTTSATDAVLALECVLMAQYLWREAASDRWRTGLWCWVLGLVSFSSFLGAVAHGFEWPNPIGAGLWKTIYFSLGILVALFLVGAIHDWQGHALAQRLIPWSIGAGVAFFVLTELFQGTFIVFVFYEATVLVGALSIYLFLAVTHQVKGAGVLSLAILLNLAAAGVQASHVSVRIIFPFDHNGIFHLVQMVGIATLVLGLHRGRQLDANSEGLQTQWEIPHDRKIDQ